VNIVTRLKCRSKDCNEKMNNIVTHLQERGVIIETRFQLLKTIKQYGEYPYTNKNMWI